MLHLDELFQFNLGWIKEVTVYQLARYFWPAEGALVLDHHWSWGFPTILLIEFRTMVKSQGWARCLLMRLCVSSGTSSVI